MPAEILQKQCRQRCMNLVGVNPARDVQQVSDVLGTGASRARSGGALWQSGRGSQVRITVGRWTKVGGRKKLLSPTHVLLLIEGEHGGNKPSGGLPVGANGCSASSRDRLALRGQVDQLFFVTLARTCA